MKCVEEAVQWNGELGGLGFMINVRPTIKSFSKSISRRELKEELNAEKFLVALLWIQLFYIWPIHLFLEKDDGEKFVEEAKLGSVWKKLP